MADLMAAIEMAPRPQKEYLQQLFKNVPIASRSCRIVNMEADTKFISANEPCNSIWVLIEGRVRAIEEQISGDVYAFTEFQAPELFGEMEVLAGIPYYKVTLSSASYCRFVVIPMNRYLGWIRNDAEALFLRVRTIMRHTLEASENDRSYLFLDGVNRLILYMTQYYRKNEENKVCTMQIKRQQIADETGFSTKTINRSIKKLSDKGLITLDGRKIVITEKQYEQLLELIDNKINS